MQSVVLLLAALLGALPLGAEPRLAEPRDGAELAGGSLATVAWTGEAGEHVEEWEAFLSVDGGRWFSTRITPHLDASIRSFAFEVPNVATRDARILLRFGDEGTETEVEVPARFAIRFDPAAVRTRVASARGDGEPARPGARGVVQWVSGARDGSGLQTFARRGGPRASAPAMRSRAVHEENAEAEDGESAVAPHGEAAGALDAPAGSSAPPRPMPHAADVLLLTRRLNL